MEVNAGMKKLIDAAAVERMKSEGIMIVHVDGNTLLTPSARDAISVNGMTIQEGSCSSEEPAAAVDSRQVDVNLIFKVLSSLQEQGLLQDILSACAAKCKPYDAEYDAAGFKLIRGNSIRTEVLDTGVPGQDGKVNYQEIIGSDDESSISAGIITIDNVEFDWKTDCQEIYYIVSGCITVTINGKVYEAKPGDAFFIKKGIRCAFGAKGFGKAFYTTY